MTEEPASQQPTEDLHPLRPPIPCDPRQPFRFSRVDAGIVGPERGPGTWYFLSEHEAPYIACPECGRSGRLGKHQVQPHPDEPTAAIVWPSIVCPMNSCGDGVVRCRAHYYGVLAGYYPAGGAR